MQMEERMEKLFLSAEEVAEVMGISTAYAYKVIQRMNKELKKRRIPVNGMYSSVTWTGPGGAARR